jgi:hypothetical protein
MVKQKTQAVIDQRKKDQKKTDWLEERKKYFIRRAAGDVESVLADYYEIEDRSLNGEADLFFLAAIGDEMVEVARFKDWVAVSLDLNSINK